MSLHAQFSTFAADCVHRESPGIITAFATHSSGVHVKGDGLIFPPDPYNPAFRTGDCPDCEFFPTVPRKQPGLKACVFDNTGDILPNFGDFFNSSVNMVRMWTQLGNRAIGHWGSQGHCKIHSFEEIVSCLDDGTGRLTPKSLPHG